jgi:hypothetical protein
MSGDFAQNVDLVSKFATVAAFVFTTGTFWFLYFRRRKSEEYSMQMTVVDS